MASKRRERGTGSVYEDTKRPGRYLGEITIDGRRRRVSGPTKTAVRAKLAALKDEAARGQVSDRRMTVSEAVDIYLEREVPGRDLSPATVAQYEWAAGHVVDEIGTIRLANLTVERVEDMLSGLADDLGASGLRHVRGALYRTLAAAVRRGHVQRNVAALASLPAGTPPAPRRALTADDARTLLATLHNERNGAMFGLSLLLGLRPGEAGGLYWDDLVDGTVNVVRSARTVRGTTRIVDELKTARSRRTIGMPSDLSAWIADHRANQNRERLAAPAWNDPNLVFATPTGHVIDPSNKRRQLADICARAGVPVVRPNELRHSCASLLSDEGVPLELIADLLGHTSTRMLQATYRHRLRPVVDVAANARWISQG